MSSNYIDDPTVIDVEVLDGGSVQGTKFTPGSTLILDDYDVLHVNVTNQVEEGNPLPVSSEAVRQSIDQALDPWISKVEGEKEAFMQEAGDKLDAVSQAAESTLQQVAEQADATLAEAKEELESDKNAFLEEAGDALEEIREVVLESESAPPIVCDASGETIAVSDSAERLLHGLTLYGKTTQDGTPTPEVPVELVSVGASGSVGVTVSGKNLASAQMVYVGAPYYAEMEEDGKRCIKFHSSQDVKNVPFAFQENTRYTISLDAKTVLVATANGTPENILSVWYTDGTKQVQNMLPDKPWTHITITTYAGKTVTAIGVISTNYISDIFVDIDTFQIEEGKTATAYEPYKGQALAALTPDGLPGIPVTSGGNYTDSTGQMWVCDEVDFARGKYVQRIGTFVLDESTSVTIVTTSAGVTLFRFVTTDAILQRSTGHGSHGLCTHYNVNRSTDPDDTESYVWLTPVRLTTDPKAVYIRDDRFSTAEEFTAWLNANPVTMQYILATPIETDLSAEELAQYAALHSNKPTTTVFNDAGAGMAVAYVADTKTYIDNKLAAISAAVLNA